MLFFSFFKTLVNHEVTVELKNDVSIRGTLKSVDQYLNIKLDNIAVVEEMKYPHLVRAIVAYGNPVQEQERLRALCTIVIGAWLSPGPSRRVRTNLKTRHTDVRDK